MGLDGMVGCSNPYVADKMDAKEGKAICAPGRSLMVIIAKDHFSLLSPHACSLWDQ